MHKRAIVIGSGFGGAVTACRLVEAAKQKTAEQQAKGEPVERWEIIVLERGRRYGKDDFPRLQLPEAMTSSEDLKSSQALPDFGRFSWRTDYGLFDTRNLGGLLVMQAAGLGGGSLIYANVLLRAPASELRKWPAIYKRDKLDPYYRLVESMLGAVTAPNGPQMPEKSRMFDSAVANIRPKEPPERSIKLPLAINFPSENGNAEGIAPNAFDRDQGKCNGCGDCVIGCPRHAKNTLDLNYLAIVEDASEIAQIWTMAEVTGIRRQDPKPEGAADERRQFVLNVVRHDQGEATHLLYADYVFLCAGAIGSTELLWHNGKALGISPLAQACVGERLFGNGDSLGVVFDTNEPASPWVGPTITRGVVHVERAPENGDGQGRRQRTGDDSATWFLIQDGGIPPSLRRLLGYFNSGMWLGRNRFKAPPATVMPVPQRAGPLTDLFVDVPLLTGLFKGKKKEGEPDGQEERWRRYLPKDVQPFLSTLIKPQEWLQREVKHLDKVVLERVQVEFGRRFGMASWFPGLRSVFNQDLLLESVMSALRERFTVLGYLPKSGEFTDSLLAALLYLVLGKGPTPNSMVLLCMGPDDAWTLKDPGDGRLRADRDRDGQRADVNLYGTQDRALRDFTKRLGGELRTNPNWTVGRRPITVHAQGGCGMRTETRSGVTDEHGRVLTTPNEPAAHLYVMDAAGFPGSVGVNPSLTIAAVAEAKVEHFIREEMKVEFSAKSPNPHQLTDVPLLDDLISAAPSVEHHPIGLKWSEWMEGSVGGAPLEAEPNVWDCTNGERVGVSEGTYVLAALNCTVRDLELFYLEQQPKVWIQGEITLRGRDGAEKKHPCSGTIMLVFERDRMVRMEYTIHLEGTSPGLLRGIKFLTDNAGLDSFLDITTLFMKLTEPGTVPSPARRVNQPGIVRVAMVTFLAKQLPTFELTGASDLDATAKLWAATRFANFFFSGLKQTYLPELFVKRVAS